MTDDSWKMRPQYISMLAFIGYVNALVIGRRIVQQLPDTILTHELMRRLDAQTVERITGEKPELVCKRKQAEQDLQALQEIADTLTSFL